MTVLVTGGGGFVGSHLVDHLLAETAADVLVLDDFSTGDPSNLTHVDGSDRVTIRTGDVRDREAVAEAVADADAVYHLAAAVGVERVVDRPLEALRTNLHGTEHVLDAAAADATPVFLASSSEVYGKGEAVPFAEDDDRVLGPTGVPRWGYAAAKATDEFLALAYHAEADLPVVVGRYFNVVGPRQTGEYGMVVPTFVEQALAGDPLTVYGDGSQTRSFTHVRDAVELTHELLETPAAHGEVFNVGAPEPTSVNDLAERVLELTGADAEVTHVPFAEAYGEDFEEPDRREPDVRRLREAVGWAPEADLDRILRDVIAERRAGVAADD
jgi:UDP-glucose 4-epimerase